MTTYSTKLRPYIQLANQAEEVSIDNYKAQLNTYVNQIKETLDADYETNYEALHTAITTLTPEVIQYSSSSTVTLNLQANKVYVAPSTSSSISSLTISENYPVSPYETLIFFQTMATGTPTITFPANFTSLNPDEDWVLEASSKYVISLLYGVFAIKKLVDNTVSS